MEKIYQQMWTAAFPKIKAGQVITDDQIDNPADNRKGITLLIRLSPQVINNMQQLLQKAKVIAPNQYYYPVTDLHLTTLSIFSCQAGFKLNQINLPQYQQVIRHALKGFPAFPIDFSGITLSPTGIVAKGYDTTGTLNEIRTAIRKAFKATDLINTIDKRYVLKAAHSTLIRFRKPLLNPVLFASFLEENQTFQFGKTVVKTIDLVFNDWYMKKENVSLLKQYPLL